MYKNIETERLLIRPINLSDYEFIIELVNSEGWLKFIGDKNIYNKKEAEKYIEKILGNPNYYYSVFQLKKSKEPIGLVTFLNRDDQKFPDIGFAILPVYENNGHVLEASKSYLQEIIKTDKHEKIIAIAFPDNQKSIRLLEKLGLNYESDHVGENGILSVFSLSTDINSADIHVK